MRISLFCWQCRPTEAAHIISNYAVMLCKQVELVIPHARIKGESMNKDKRWAVPSHFVIKLGTIYWCCSSFYNHMIYPFK